MSPPRESVFLVDDDPAVLKSLSRLLRTHRLKPLTFDSSGEFLRRLDSPASGCVVLDLSMPGLDGLALQEELVARKSELQVLFLTGRGDISTSVRAMKLGAEDFLTKPVDEVELLRAIRRALEKSRERRRAREEGAELRSRFATLTPREREVLEGIVAGQLNKQVAGYLGTAVKTIKVHRGRLMAKMGADSLPELVRMAERLGVGKARRNAPGIEGYRRGPSPRRDGT